MRTTLTLDDDIFEAAQAQARASGKRLRSIGHQQVDDAWLVAVARHNGGRLVTFDTRLPAHAFDAGQVEVIT